MALWIGLHGKAGSGKDTIGGELVERYGFTRVAFADAVKHYALALDPWVEVAMCPDQSVRDDLGVPMARLSYVIGIVGPERAKDIPDVRDFYQKLGTEVGRDIDPQTWTSLARRKAADLERPVVFTDVRFETEARMVQHHGPRPGFVVHLTRPSSRDLGEQATHSSEATLPPDLIDIELANLDAPGVVAERLMRSVVGLL